jgi:hypothetical protein
VDEHVDGVCVSTAEEARDQRFRVCPADRKASMHNNGGAKVRV